MLKSWHWKKISLSVGNEVKQQLSKWALPTFSNKVQYKEPLKENLSNKKPLFKLTLQVIWLNLGHCKPNRIITDSMILLMKVYHIYGKSPAEIIRI